MNEAYMKNIYWLWKGCWHAHAMLVRYVQMSYKCYQFIHFGKCARPACDVQAWYLFYEWSLGSNFEQALAKLSSLSHKLKTCSKTTRHTKPYPFSQWVLWTKLLLSLHSCLSHSLVVVASWQQQGPQNLANFLSEYSESSHFCFHFILPHPYGCMKAAWGMTSLFYEKRDHNRTNRTFFVLDAVLLVVWAHTLTSSFTNRLNGLNTNKKTVLLLKGMIMMEL
jgi:hypothetical protein